MDVIVKGSPNIEVGFSTKVIKVGAVDSDGRYPDMSVGFADDLVGRGESVPAEFSFRASGGKSIKDGAARIKRLKGNSVVWNQKYKPISSAIGTQTINGVTFTLSEDGTMEAEGTAEGGSAVATLSVYKTFVASHKYLLIAYGAPAGEWSKQGLYFSGIIGLNSASMITSAGYKIFQPSADGSSGLTLTAREGYSLSCRFRPTFYDLTQMFGAGNEPTTVEEFYARKPIVEDEYAYNEGEVIHMTAEGIKSVGDNAWDEEWELGKIDTNNGELVSATTTIRSKNAIRVIPGSTYYYNIPNVANSSYMGFAVFYDNTNTYVSYSAIAGNAYKNVVTPSNAEYMRFYLRTDYGNTYNHDIMITLVHSGWKQDTDAAYQPYWEDRLIFDQRIKDEFPDGMKSAGTAHDMAYNDMNKGVGVTETRIGVVDMGTLNWAYGAPTEGRPHGYFFSDINGRKNGKSNLLCSRYFYANADLSVDKSIYGLVADKTIIVVDSSYTDAASFKAAMAGVMLYYELAEPTIIEYDEPFNLDYKVADFGTEQAIAEQPSAPISADIIYQFNAVDMIREHELEIAELQSIIATMQAQLASLTSNNE